MRDMRRPKLKRPWIYTPANVREGRLYPELEVNLIPLALFVGASIGLGYLIERFVNPPSWLVWSVVAMCIVSYLIMEWVFDG